jgi:hypothetical protein
MCFYHGDADWYASVVHEDIITSDKPVSCDECGRKMPPGEKFKHVHQQEREYCDQCSEDEPCPEGECDYGETFDYDVCEHCQKFLAAIQHVEADEGCKGAEQQPALGLLIDSLWEADGTQDYIDRARAEYPELAASGYLDRMYRHTREWAREHEERWDAGDVGPTDEMGGES